MSNYVFPIILGTVAGVVTRIIMLRTDYRQYPSHLHGKIIHIALGLIAAGLGSIILPALLREEFTAITFLTLAASQFRDVRNMERNTLTQLDSYELVSRGSTYIEGIAIAFESRNYLVIFTSLLTTASYIFISVWAAVAIALICFFCAVKLMSGATLKKIVDIKYEKPHFKDSGLYIDNIYIMNIGLPEKQELILKYGMGFILTPKNFNAKTTIANLGQRQAILFDVSTVLGIYRDSGEPSLSPLAKRDLEDGRVGIFVLPQVQEIDEAIKVIEDVPTLENAIRMSTERKKKKTKR
ncbi:YIEGIA family protein [Bacillus gobiensis]|uniref:YIEGIA family protein n=1 Tax=Bacillus gobiensis TaxID=1441095 RepID=UPI003D21D6D7